MLNLLTKRYRVPNIIAASVAISLFGFFSGPLFAAVSHATAAETAKAYTFSGDVCWIQAILI
jgi:hypothetical protein